MSRFFIFLALLGSSAWADLAKNNSLKITSVTEKLITAEGDTKGLKVNDTLYSDQGAREIRITAIKGNSVEAALAGKSEHKVGQSLSTIKPAMNLQNVQIEVMKNKKRSADKASKAIEKALAK